jgi:NitT/TauT family transport system substrate-binding protein
MQGRRTAHGGGKRVRRKGFDRFDRLTVTMTQADATAALMTGSAGISAHFGNSPFQFQQLDDPKIRTVLNSYDVMGGPQTFGVVWTTAKFREENPTLYKAVFAALSEAIDKINADKKAASELYVQMSNSKTKVDFVYKILTNPQVGYSLAPLSTLKLAQFMYKVGQIKN